MFRAGTRVAAVDDVSFSIEAGETFGLVGESGSGKTTTGRCMLRLIEPSSGDVRFRGENVLAFSSRRLREARRDMQIVFQDPYSSLNPRMRARQIVEEPLIIHKLGARAARARARRRAVSPGRPRSRRTSIAIRTSSAAASASGSAWRARSRSNPSFVILDEPVSALDVSVQAQVVNLLMDLQQQLNLTYLFIAHDLRLVEHICSRVAVMYLGKIVEMGPTAALVRVAAARLHQGAAVGDSGAGPGRAASAHRSGSGVSEPPGTSQRDRRGPLGGSVKVKT